MVFHEDKSTPLGQQNIEYNQSLSRCDRVEATARVRNVKMFPK